MNWYKKSQSQLQESLPYFQDFEEDQYIPDQEKLINILKTKFNTEIVSNISSGDSGVAYLLSNGDVLKITTNSQEAKVAEWLISNPHPSIIAYKYVWNDNGLSYIIMEKLDSLIKDNNILNRLLISLSKLLEKNNCYDINCALVILKQHAKNIDISVIFLVIDYLEHLSFLAKDIKIFDFLNPDNIGFKDGKLKFFDIT